MKKQLHGMGWHRDLPDCRDYKAGDVLPTTSKALHAAPESVLPPNQDLSQWCSPIEDQEDLGPKQA